MSEELSLIMDDAEEHMKKAIQHLEIGLVKIRAGRANMFLSDVFTNSFVNTLNIPVDLYNCDGSVGAAIGAGIGAKVYATAKEAFVHTKPLATIEPGTSAKQYDELYEQWKALLEKSLS